MVQNNVFTFSIATVLGATAIIGVLLSYGHVWQVLFIIGQILVVILGSEFLLRKIPSRVKELQRLNCYRADGSISEHRRSTEFREYFDLRSSVRTVFAIVVIPFAMLIFYEGIGPLMVTALTLSWLFAGFAILRSGYLYYLNKFVFDLKRRNQQYKLRDLDLVIRNEEMAATEKRFVTSTNV